MGSQFEIDELSKRVEILEEKVKQILDLIEEPSTKKKKE